MAKSQKKTHPPATLQAPSALVPIMHAFHAESKEAAHALIMDAVKAITPESYTGFKAEPSKEDIEVLVSLMRGLNPRDSLETLFAAQIIVSHMLGMRKMASTYPDDQRLGLKMLKFSNEAMQSLDRKRNGGIQNITVNYNHNGDGNSFAQTVIKDSPCQ